MPMRDVVTPFDAFWRTAKVQDDATRVRRFKAEVVPAFPEFYAYRFALWSRRGKDVDAEVAQHLRAFEAFESRYAAVESTVRRTLQAAAMEFRRTFQDFRPSAQIVLLNSLGEMDGGTRSIGHRSYLLFGLDGIAKYQPDGDRRSFFFHEFFHVYHDDVRGRDRSKEDSLEEMTKTTADPLYISLWEEGLATYVSEWLHPGASKEELSLSTPENLISETEKNLAYLANDFASKLDSHDVVDYEAYFTSGSNDPRRPKHAGYYLGYLVAKKLQARVQMPVLVRLDGAPLRREIAIALSELATASSPGSKGSVSSSQ
ncbi:MAG TPA: hypothetical protein VNO21_22925 [Polyangiaceae bacterium]|nr:hypothetical protein [Polyangiaceae bacterium]